uniref:Ion transport domain-containing protein n=1 Tax=Chromera velia CCMP2878 TaxID=1169474 RepID=A0A0G4HKS6_9ALVE|eukprot:Cvel_7266.t1-p1 / transcript=Cvel_7266.t1 / gene=Cvel_7266 / organism=Chromera_velia_CCMP2878 / gene_product=Serine/threonine-protein phosphatase 6 regulatory, putative / transcript_product=Serine/threonine-protein phosphatase 6 regulatory, putative / location=Cvel_scaffold375:62401-78304(+) / protein_length=1240 / sequence_SO=supercontig / SO=protein_coding / is_pseudo=false
MPTLNGEHHIYPLNSPNSVGERNEWESVDSEEDERQQSELESLGHLCSRRRSRSGSSHLSSSSSSVSADLAREEAEVQEKIEVMPSISSASSSSSSSSSPEMRSTVQKRGRRESKTKGVLQKAREKVNSRGVLPLVRSSASDSERRGDHYEAAEGERGGVGRESAERISSFGWSHFERIVEDASSGGPKVKKLPSRLPSNPPTEKAEGGQGTTPKTPQVPGTSALTPGTKSRPAPVPATPSQAPSPEATAAGSPLSKEGRKGEGGSEKVEEGSPQPQGAEEGGGMAGPPALSLPIPRGKGRSSILKKDTPGSRWGNLMEIPQGPEEMEGAKGPAPPRGGKAEPLGSFKRPVLVPLHTDDWKEEATENWTEGTAFHLAAFKGYKDTLKQMMKKIDFEFQNGMTPVHLAAMEGHAETVTQLLYMGADVNEKTNDGTTPLHLAALNGQVDVAQSLVENEADVYAEDANSNTPLHLAAENGQEKAATVLLNNGADMTEKQEELLSPEAADRLFSWAPELRSLDYLRTLCGDSEAAAKAGTKGLGKMFDVLLSRAVTRRDPLCFCLEAIRVCKQRDRLVDDYLSHEFRKGTERLRFLCNLLLATEDAEGLVKRGGRRLLHLVASTDEREMARHPDIVKALEEENNPLPFYGIDGMFNPSSWRMMMFVSLLLLICSCFLSASGLVVLVGDPDLTITAETIRQVLQTPLGVPIIAVVYLSICHLHVELREMLATHPGQYLSSPLNILEALAYVMLIIGTIVALLSDVMAANLYTMLILCGFTLSLRILVYAMSLNYVGALVFTAVRMMGDVMIFSVLLVFLLVIFSATVFFLAQSYPALVEYEDLPTFQSFENTFLDLFNSLIGLYEPNVYPFQAAVDVGATVVALFIVLWMIVAVIMMLNFLIALMSKSYDTVEKDTAGYIALFRLRLWATVTALSPEVRLPPFISLWFFWLTWVKRKVNSENYDDSPGYRMFVNCVVIVQFACYAPFMIFQITSLRGTRRRILWLVIWFVTIALYPLVVFLAGAAFICAPQKRLKWWSQPGHINLEMSWLTQSPDLAARETNEKHVKIRTGALEQLRLEELKTAAVQVDVKRKITVGWSESREALSGRESGVPPHPPDVELRKRAFGVTAPVTCVSHWVFEFFLPLESFSAVKGVVGGICLASGTTWGIVTFLDPDFETLIEQIIAVVLVVVSHVFSISWIRGALQHRMNERLREEHANGIFRSDESRGGDTEQTEAGIGQRRCT